MKNLLLFLTTLICFGLLHCNTIHAKDLKVGDKAPNFVLMDQNGNSVKLSDFAGQKVALYFYPKDNTPGCSQQACSLKAGFDTLADENITILGVSRGSTKSKQKFIKNKELPFTLLIATDDILKAYGVYRGLFYLYLPQRWTFLIDENGIIVAIIKDVDTKNHAQQIIDAFNTLA